MKILVLGGQGFIGYNLCSKLVEYGYQVSVFGQVIDPDRIIKECNYIAGDFSNIDEYVDIFEGVDVVYHLISTTNPGTSNNNITQDIETNLISTIKMLNNCVKKHVKKVIFASSGGTVYGVPETLPISEEHKTNPICSYGITKLAIEKYLELYNRMYNLEYMILRLANPYGPFHVSNSQGLINVYLNKVIENNIIEIWGDGEVSRDYIYIDDVVNAMCLSLNSNIKNEVLNIGSGEGTTINDVIKIMEESLGMQLNKVYKESRNVDVPINILDINKAKQKLNWLPQVNIKEGIIKTYDAIKQTKTK